MNSGASTRRFSQRSITSMTGVHPDLIRVIAHALQTSPVDFTVIEGRRTEARQRELVASGASRTMNSRHLHGLAVDLMPIDPKTGKGSFDWPLYHQLAPAVKNAAEAEGVPITWGGDWVTLKDGPHFELPHALYPDRMAFSAVHPLDVKPRAWPPVAVAAREPQEPPTDAMAAWLASAPPGAVEWLRGIPA